MRTLLEEMLIALFMGMILPGMILSAAVWVQEDRQMEQVVLAVAPSEAPMPSHPILVLSADGIETEMELESYLVGVVLAEMPASFEQEALKAQAVVARTYTLRTESTGGKHGNGSLCTQASCCQAYIKEQEFLEKGGTEADLEKVRCAVEETAGQVLTYEGQLIEATYFSCSGGQTEDAVAVWGADFPYLRSVESPGEESAAYFTDSVTFTYAEFQNALGVSLEGKPEHWFGEIVKTTGNGVETMTIGGEKYRGTELRAKLGLRSTAFSVCVEGDTISVHTKGYGHRVGMSQYGAEAMAAVGSTYSQILAHYYQGTELVTMP